MMPPTPSTAASSSRVADRMASSEPNQAARARAATGPTWRMLSATRKRHSSFVLAFSSSSSSVSATDDGPMTAGRSLRAGSTILRNGVRRSSEPSSSVLRSPVSASRTTTSMGISCSSVRSNRPASVTSGGGHLGLGERRRPHLAETFDVERATRSDVLDTAAHLRRAGPRVGAAQIDVALLGGRERGAACGAVRRHHELAFGAVAQLDDRAEHLRDHIARLAQHDGVADEHALRLHDVLVVQGGLPHRGAGDVRGLPSARTG